MAPAPVQGGPSCPACRGLTIQQEEWSGAAITVWSALRAYILAPLPFTDLNRLVTIWEVDPGNRDIWRAVTTGNFADWRRDQKSFEGFAAGINRSFTLTSFEDSVTPLMREVSFGYFEVLGVKPQLGRTFSREEEREGGPPVVMLSHDLWTQRFGASTSILGKTTGLDALIEGRLFQVSPFDPRMYLAGAAAVSVLMLLAAASPALRAARVNAAVTLKEG